MNITLTLSVKCPASIRVAAFSRLSRRRQSPHLIHRHRQLCALTAAAAAAVRYLGNSWRHAA